MLWPRLRTWRLPTASTAAPVRAAAVPLHRPALAAVLLLAALLDSFRLDKEGYGNPYYADTVRSMLTSWHNFFFVSFDPLGFVSVEKPPLGLWIQAASARLLGFQGTSLLIPQAVAGVLSVALLYHLVQRAFGVVAGLLAALTLALTPISVATNRNNTADSLLVLTLLLAAWAVSRAAETGLMRWLLLCAVLVGLGFNIKMLQAYLPVPGFALLYLVASPLRWRTRVAHLALATLVLAAVSLSWATVVDLTPSDQRPYVGGSQNNSVLDLIIRHNGLERLAPSLLAGQSGQQSPRPVSTPQAQVGQPSAQTSPESGTPGRLRLLNRQLAGQISWLLPLALLGLVVAAGHTRFRRPPSRQHQSLLLFGSWLLVSALVFSLAGILHRYYLVMLTPAIGALVGAGAMALWEDYCRPGRRGWLLPLALLGSVAVQAYILAPFPAWSHWITPTIVGLCAAAAAGLVIARSARWRHKRGWAGTMAAGGMLALLIGPTVWATTPVWAGGDPFVPYAGPELLDAQGRGSPQVDPGLVQYLQAHRGGARFLLATFNADVAAPLYLATGEPVMEIGGWDGHDPILKTDQLAQLVAANAVRFFLLPPDIMVSPDLRAQVALARWVDAHCARAPVHNFDLRGPCRV